jgi:ATP-dependent DNA helicase DinG
MAQAVTDAVDSGTHLLVQAGTGTGKSLGYLVPALHSGKSVVVSTATLALQSQLVEHDVPRLLETLGPHLSRTPSFALLKGRSNYACLAKLEGAAEADSLFSEGTQWLGELSRVEQQFGAVREWTHKTETGERTDLDPGVDDAMWRRISVSSRECVGAQRCPFGEECFAERAKAKARQADIVITNHALLALDMLHDRSVLPTHDVVVVDEAHELAGHVTNVARAELVPEFIRRLVRRATQMLSVDLTERFEAAEAAFDNALAVLPAGRLETIPEALGQALTLLDSVATTAAAMLTAAAKNSEAKNNGEVSVNAHQDLQQLTELSEISGRMVENNSYDVTWVSVDDQERRRLVVAPLSVIGQLGKHLFADRTVIATSATLTLGGELDAAAGDLGLKLPDAPAWSGIDVGSPFAYPQQGILYVAARLPRLTASGLPDVAQRELLELVEAAGGRTLGLFSSRRAASQAAEAVRGATDLPVLLQGDDSLTALVRQFRESPSSCLFGVMSLWQGVDVPGDACQLVVIDRLPFPRPDDPLIAARSAAADKAGASGFGNVFVPHAAVRLAQGAGRLIRSSTDKGVVAVLDSRLHSASYGKYLRRSLPDFWYTTKPDVAREALRRLDAAAKAPVPA